MLHNWEPIFPFYIFDRGSQVMQVGLQLTVWARPSMKLNCVLSRAFYPSTSGNHCFSFITTKQKNSTRCLLTFQYSLQTLQKPLTTVWSWHCHSHMRTSWCMERLPQSRTPEYQPWNLNSFLIYTRVAPGFLLMIKLQGPKAMWQLRCLTSCFLLATTRNGNMLCCRWDKRKSDGFAVEGVASNPNFAASYLGPKLRLFPFAAMGSKR